MSEHHDERRRFKRIAFEAPVKIKQGPQRWQTTLVDLSLKGLLVQRPQPWTADETLPFIIEIDLTEEVRILMDGKLAHDDHDTLGFKCLHIGLESVYHLRRLIEWNLGDEAELVRELGEMIE